MRLIAFWNNKDYPFLKEVNSYASHRYMEIHQNEEQNNAVEPASPKIVLPEKQSTGIGKILSGIALGLFILYALLKLVIALFNILDIDMNVASLPFGNSHNKEVRVCVDKIDATTENKVIGKKQYCAIQVAATFYDNDPEGAIDLCVKYSLDELQGLAESINLGSSALNKVAPQSCRLEIEERVKQIKDGTATNEFRAVTLGDATAEGNNNTSDAPSNNQAVPAKNPELILPTRDIPADQLARLTYRNSKHGYELLLREGDTVVSNEMRAETTESCCIIAFNAQNNSDLISIDSYDHNNLAQFSEGIRPTMGSSIDEYVAWLVQHNEYELIGGEPIQTTTLGGASARAIIVKVKFTEPTGGRMFSQNGPQIYTVYIVDNGSFRYTISVPGTQLNGLDYFAFTNINT